MAIHFLGVGSDAFYVKRLCDGADFKELSYESDLNQGWVRCVQANGAIDDPSKLEYTELTWVPANVTCRYCARAIGVKID